MAPKSSVRSQRSALPCSKQAQVARRQRERAKEAARAQREAEAARQEEAMLELRMSTVLAHNAGGAKSYGRRKHEW